jgi:hypothetical protein
MHDAGSQVRHITLSHARTGTSSPDSPKQPARRLPERTHRAQVRRITRQNQNTRDSPYNIPALGAGPHSGLSTTAGTRTPVPRSPPLPSAAAARLGILAAGTDGARAGPRLAAARLAAAHGGVHLLPRGVTTAKYHECSSNARDKSVSQDTDKCRQVWAGSV